MEECYQCNKDRVKSEVVDVYLDLNESFSDNPHYEKTVRLCPWCKKLWDDLPSEYKK
tara:strand:+ start:224 stop:394 length:171 start_codon:yes stop_codon:yes gene_type:complete